MDSKPVINIVNRKVYLMPMHQVMPVISAFCVIVTICVIIGMRLA